MSLFFTDGMSEQSLALVPGPKQHVLAAGSGKSSLPEMGMLQDTPKGSLELLQPCLIWGHAAPSLTSHLQVSKIIEYTEGGIAENLKVSCGNAEQESQKTMKKSLV